MTTPPLPRILTVKQAAHVVGVSERTIRRWLTAGKVAGAWRTEGGHARIPREWAHKVRTNADKPDAAP